MALTREVVCLHDRFNRGQTYSTTPGFNGWTIRDTSSSGTPTYANQNNGGFKATLAATSEEEIVTLHQNDVLFIPLQNMKLMRFNMLVGAFDANTNLVAGLASAQNDTEDSVTTNCWFKVIGGASGPWSVVCETDDNTTDTDDVSTGATLTTTSKEFVIDFSNGYSDIRFYIDGSRVASSTTFAMAAITSSTYVQPFFQLHKASGTGVGYFQLDRLEVEYTKAWGA